MYCFFFYLSIAFLTADGLFNYLLSIHPCIAFFNWVLSSKPSTAFLLVNHLPNCPMSSYASITSVTVPYLSNHIVPSLTACFFLTSPLPFCLSINFLTIYLHILPSYLWLSYLSIAFLINIVFLPLHYLSVFSLTADILHHYLSTTFLLINSLSSLLLHSFLFNTLLPPVCTAICLMPYFPH